MVTSQYLSVASIRLPGTPNAAFQTGLAVSRFVGRTITKLMRKKKNDLVGAHYQSFSRFEHYPHGERKRDKVPDTTGNMFVDYSIFATTY